MAATACRPFEHSPMISKSLSVLSNCRIRARAGASSSTMRVRIFMSAGGLSPGAFADAAWSPFGLRRRDNQDLWLAFTGLAATRDEEPGLQSTSGSRRQFEPVIGAVKMRKARARVGKANAFAARRDFGFRQTRAVVAHFKFEHSVQTPGGDFHPTGVLARFDAVPDGVLDERLQDQGRDQDVVEAGLDLHLHCEAVLKPRLLDLQVAFEEREFLPQGHLLAFGLFQADAQEFAQARYD